MGAVRGQDVREVDLIVRNAGELLLCSGPETGVAGAAVSRLEVIRDGAVAVSGDRIVDAGTTADIDRAFRSAHVIDADGALVSPAFVDPHSHLLYGGSAGPGLFPQIAGAVDGLFLGRFAHDIDHLKAVLAETSAICY